MNISQLDEVILESEYEVLNNLLDAYDKAYTIIENYQGDDLNAFSIFQESSIVQEASWKETEKQKLDKPEFKFRQNNEKTGKKENILKSFMKLIPRLIEHVQDLHRRKMEMKKLKLVTEQAKKIGVDVSKMSPGETELFYTLINQNVPASELKEILRKENFKHDVRMWLTKQGLKVGGGAIVIGGTAYALNNKKELIESKISDFKGEIMKKFDETVLSEIREAGSKAADTISKAADKAAEKIADAAKRVQEVMRKAIEFIKKLYDGIRKFFNINLLKYDQVTDDGILCKIDVKAGTLYVTIDLDMWSSWIDFARDFIVQAAALIGRKFTDGKLEKNTNAEGKAVRSGAIYDFQKEHDKSNVVTKYTIHPDAESAINKFTDNMRKLADDKTKKKNSYSPISSFSEKAEALSEKLTKMCQAAKSLSAVYESRLKDDTRDDRWVDTEKLVSEKIRGILDTQVTLTNGISAVNEYITTVAEMSDSLSIVASGSEPPSDTSITDKKEDE
jgi:hypothetical protein